ncbi:MAG: DUF1446 domain-containing protein [Lactobacillus sp.]|jgi:hypothetical protein|nr:DUF1446 domain-containing protein [Lactobacillus sp.]MCI2034204.1 DUF1446 domain-containing protein [Lactobacillus sp.]
MEELRILVPNGMLGYGFPLADFQRGMAQKPHAIIVDAGSTDSGPQKLALGSMTCPESAYEKELDILVPAALAAHIPLIVTSAGGDGTDQHVDLFAEIVRRIAANHHAHLRLATIHSDVPKAQVQAALDAGQIQSMVNAPTLTPAVIADTTVITAQMGAEPYLDLLRATTPPDVIIGGRTYDPSATAAMGILNGFDPALSWHMGKIIECGAICCVPAGKTVLGRLFKDHFLIEPMAPESRALPHTVAAHTMYEKSSALVLPGPGGKLYLHDSQFTAATPRIASVTGSRFEPTPDYQVKLEGAKVVGYRAITIMGLRDPILLSQLDEILAALETQVAAELPDEWAQSQVHLHRYGQNATMQQFEPTPTIPHELCLIAEVTAPDQDTALLVANRLRTTLLHYGYAGRIATSGNIGMPFTPLEIPLGEVCAFSVYHLMTISDPVGQFPVHIEEVQP